MILICPFGTRRPLPQALAAAAESVTGELAEAVSCKALCKSGPVVELHPIEPLTRVLELPVMGQPECAVAHAVGHHEDHIAGLAGAPPGLGRGHGEGRFCRPETGGARKCTRFQKPAPGGREVLFIRHGNLPNQWDGGGRRFKGSARDATADKKKTASERSGLFREFNL